MLIDDFEKTEMNELVKFIVLFLFDLFDFNCCFHPLCQNKQSRAILSEEVSGGMKPKENESCYATTVATDGSCTSLLEEV